MILTYSSIQRRKQPLRKVRNQIHFLSIPAPQLRVLLPFRPLLASSPKFTFRTSALNATNTVSPTTTNTATNPCATVGCFRLSCPPALTEFILTAWGYCDSYYICHDLCYDGLFHHHCRFIPSTDWQYRKLWEMFSTPDWVWYRFWRKKGNQFPASRQKSVSLCIIRPYTDRHLNL